MRVLLYGRYGEYPKEIEGLVKDSGLEIVVPSTSLGMTTPDVVVTYGGDGAILGAEQKYPGIPKLPLRDSHTCYHCSRLPNEEVLKLLAEGKLKVKEYLKLEGVFKERRFAVLNDIAIRNKFVNAALRLKVLGPQFSNSDMVLIGDGVVVATPYGSTGYFYSITRESFTEGIGIAFNNIHNFGEKAQIIDEKDKLTIEIIRGPGVMSADNDPNIVDLVTGDRVTIGRAKETAKVLSPE